MSARTETEPAVVRAGSPRLADVTLVVVGYDCAPDDLACLDALVSSFAGGIFVDNGPQPHVLAGEAWNVVVPPENLGFAAAANLAAELASTGSLLILNPDVRTDVPTLEALAAAFDADPSLAAVGPSLAVENSIREANAGGAEKSLANALVFAFAPARTLLHRQIWRSTFPTEPELVDIDWVSGACLLIRRQELLDAGGFPTDYFLYDEDVALCLALRQRGRRLAIAGRLSVSHRVGGGQKGDAHFRRWALSNQRHVILRSSSRTRAVATLLLLMIGLVRRAGWRVFLGRSQPYRYALWSLRYLARYRLHPPPAGPELPPG